MKKNILIAALAALTLSFTACQKDDVTNGGNGGNVNPNARVKTTADLHNTNWTYTVTTTELLNNLLGTNMPCMDSSAEETYTFGLNFDGTYAHFTFPENVMVLGGDEGIMEQISSVSYEYYYDGTTHTGYLDGVADPEDEDAPAHLQFTYDDTTDVITFNLSLFYVDDETPLTLTLNFSRNNE